MIRQDFLSKLKDEGKLQLVEPSEDICSSYLKKADDCLKSARILLQNDLHENSVPMSYYAMYNSLTALLFKIGIKCENHSGAIIIFRKLFGRSDLYKMISSGKKERIDKQYYVDLTLAEKSAQDLFKKAENYLVEIKLIIQKLKNEEIKTLRVRFSRMI
jgi:uncharacterized protein (UPF0332 family)